MSNTEASTIIEFDKVNKWYASNGYHVLRDISLKFHKGEKVVICGPSGSGKSTLIRCVNALEEYQEGKLTVDGTVVGDDLKGIDRVRLKWAWCFSSSTCSPTSPCWKT